MGSFDYGFEKRVSGSFDEVVERVTEVLQEHGFGVLTEIDVQATLKKKLDVDFVNYRILGACNPNLAHRALTTDAHIGLVLPCNVVVRETNGGDVVAAFVDPKAMFLMVDNPALREVADEADQLLTRAFESL